MKKIIIISAPSGAGKNSLMNELLKDFPILEDIITYTTRKKRPGEIDNISYTFINHDKFHQLIKENFFIEWAKVHENLYGTPHRKINEVLNKNKIPIMDLDIQGAFSIKKTFPDITYLIFILPPSIEEIKKRIFHRNPNNLPEDLDVRIQNAQKEMQQAQYFDYKIVNDDFTQAYNELKRTIHKIISM